MQEPDVPVMPEPQPDVPVMQEPDVPVMPEPDYRLRQNQT